MFDVIRVSQNDSDLYDFFCCAYGQTGYFRVSWQEDPNAETVLLSHVGGGMTRGRQAVLDKLAREWGANEEEVQVRIQAATDRRRTREMHEPAGVARGQRLRVPRAFCGWTRRRQELFLLSNIPTGRFPWAANDLMQRLLPYCGPTRTARIPPVYFPAAQASDDLAEIDLDSGEVHAIETTDTGEGFRLSKMIGWFVLGAAVGALANRGR